MKKYVMKIFLALPVICMLSSFSSGHDGDIIQVPQMKQEPSQASRLTDDGYFDGLLYYKITSNSTNEVALVKVENSALTVDIPSQVIIEGKTYTCTRIENNVFMGLKRMTSVTIPNSITIIGESAFYGCSGLNSISIPNSVTSIGEHAFYECSSLTAITIPNSVTSISDGAFAYCKGLTYITIPNSVTSIRDYAFSYCSRLTDYYIWAEKVPYTEGFSFSFANIKNAILHVPAPSVEIYRQKDPWSGFGKIVPLTDDDPNPTSMKGIKHSDNLNDEYYDLTGRKVNNPKKGLYIKNGKKVILK